MTVFELFDGSGPGAYWFYAAANQSWVVADLDTGKAHQVKSMLRLDVADGSEADDLIDRRGGTLAVVGQRCLIEFDAAVRLFRDHPGDFDRDTAVSYGPDGTIGSGATVFEVLRAIGGTVKRASKNKGFQP